MKTTTTLTQTKGIILFLLVLFWAAPSFASKVYNGYLIRNDYKKEVGKIQMISPSLNEVKVKFISKAREKKTYKAREVKAYGFWVEKWNRKEKKYESTEVIYVRQKVTRSPIPFGPKKYYWSEK